MSFWLNLNYNGARVGGQREMKHFALERGCLGEIESSPDSLAGKSKIQQIETSAVEEYFR